MKNYWLNRIFYLLSRNQLVNTIKSHKNSKFKENPEKILPIVTIESITDNSEPVLAEKEHVNGNVSFQELQYISKIVKHYQPKTIFEIGTFDGRTTLNMSLNAPGAEIFTLDLPKKEIFKTRYRVKTGDLTFIDKQQSGIRFIGTESEKRIAQIYADSAQFDYSKYENSIDLIFIDGSHTYDYVISDKKIAMKLLRNKKGVIIWHDYGWYEVIKAINEFYQEGGVFADIKNVEGTSLAFLHIG